MMRFLGFLGTSFALMVGPATAQQQDAMAGKLKTFCASDYARLCADMDPKDPEVEACFRKNLSEVSPGCQAAIAEVKGHPFKRSDAKP